MARCKIRKRTRGLLAFIAGEELLRSRFHVGIRIAFGFLSRVGVESNSNRSQFRWFRLRVDEAPVADCWAHASALGFSHGGNARAMANRLASIHPTAAGYAQDLNCEPAVGLRKMSSYRNVYRYFFSNIICFDCSSIGLLVDASFYIDYYNKIAITISSPSNNFSIYYSVFWRDKYTLCL